MIDTERKDFVKKPDANHVWMDAYAVIFGHEAAFEQLRKARDK